ncbi:MAG: hypothetical protein WC100_22350, partial [Sterolibacterium sp.]
KSVFGVFGSAGTIAVGAKNAPLRYAAAWRTSEKPGMTEWVSKDAGGTHLMDVPQPLSCFEGGHRARCGTPVFPGAPCGVAANWQGFLTL